MTHPASDPSRRYAIQPTPGEDGWYDVYEVATQTLVKQMRGRKAATQLCRAMNHPDPAQGRSHDVGAQQTTR